MTGTIDIPLGIKLSHDIEIRPIRKGGKPFRARLRWTDPMTKERRSKSESFLTRELAEDWIDQMVRSSRYQHHHADNQYFRTEDECARADFRTDHPGAERGNSDAGKTTIPAPPPPPAASPSPPPAPAAPVKCTDQLNYGNHPRSNAEINSIGEQTGQCPDPISG
ncbi:hypothetical protein ACWIGW_16315 [Nocardia brasiliensis]